MAHQPLFIGALKTFTEGENGNVEFLPLLPWLGLLSSHSSVPGICPECLVSL